MPRNIDKGRILVWHGPREPPNLQDSAHHAGQAADNDTANPSELLPMGDEMIFDDEENTEIHSDDEDAVASAPSPPITISSNSDLEMLDVSGKGSHEGVADYDSVLLDETMDELFDIVSLTSISSSY
jgi:hypothetical protein